MTETARICMYKKDGKDKFAIFNITLHLGSLESVGKQLTKGFDTKEELLEELLPSYILFSAKTQSALDNKDFIHSINGKNKEDRSIGLLPG